MITKDKFVKHMNLFVKMKTAYCDKLLRNTPRNLIWNYIDYILYNVVRRAIATRFDLAFISFTSVLPYLLNVNALR